MRFNFVAITKECAKCLLLVINALCMFTAIFTFAYGVVDTRILKQYGEEHAIGTFASNMTVIGICILFIVVAVVGCVGAVKENVKILYLYTGFIMVLVILELLGGILVGVDHFGLELRVTDWLREDFFKSVSGENLTEYQKVWDDLQTTYECCGLNGPEDFTAMQKPISLSCCPAAYRARAAHAQKQLYNACVESGSYFFFGCEKEVLDTLRYKADYLFGIAIISFWFEGAALLLAMWVANNLKKSVKVYKQAVKY